MISSQNLAPEPYSWKFWKHEHPEFERSSDTKITYDGNKILIIGGTTLDETQRMFNLILMDPEKQTFKVIPSIGDDVKLCCWSGMIACYWKDSKIVVFGGHDDVEWEYQSTVAIVTLKDLDSENPSAYWEKIKTSPELIRAFSSAYIYKDKMFIFGGRDGDKKYDSWCLDLTEFIWSQCSFQDFSPQKEETEDHFIFQESKAYAIPKAFLADLDTIKEYDLETMSFKLHTIQKNTVDKKLLFEPFPQVINKKIYFFENYHFRPKDSPPIRQVFAFDLDAQSWSEIETESFPSLDFIGRMLYCSNHLIFHACATNDGWLYGEFWSLSLNPPKRSKYSSTSETINKIQQTLKEFFFEAPYSDISFEVESQIVPAHKWLLTQRNKFFSNLFSSASSKIIINDLKPPTFRALLEYLYSDHTEIDDSIALELLQKTDKYSIPDELKNACEKHLLKSIEPENYIALGKLAELIGASSLRDAVAVFIARNMKTIKQRKDFIEIPVSILRDSIVKFIEKLKLPS